MKWTKDDELTLLVLTLADAPKFTINAERIIKAWPKGGELPTARALKDRFSLLKKRCPGAKLTIGGGGTTSTLAPRPASTPTTTINGAESNDWSITTPSSNASKFKVSNLKDHLSTARNSSLPRSKISQSGRKRKRNSSDDEESTPDHTSEDDTPSKLPHRSLSLRRSASTAPKYQEEEGDAAKNIDSEEEWNGEDEGKMKRKFGWRERYARMQVDREPKEAGSEDQGSGKK